jgi:hypothetical protein
MGVDERICTSSFRIWCGRIVSVFSVQLIPNFRLPFCLWVQYHKDIENSAIAACKSEIEK